MVETSETTLKSENDDQETSSTTSTPIVFDDFIPWFHSRVTFYKPDIIVAIARGAIRLLQLHGINDTYLFVNIVADHALPFYPNHEIEGKRILIFDDCINENMYRLCYIPSTKEVSSGSPGHRLRVADFPRESHRT